MQAAFYKVLTENKPSFTEKKLKTIATQRSRNPQNFASIQGKPTLITCRGKITIINPVLTSKGKFPKAVDNKSVQGTVKETSAAQATIQRIEKACPEPKDLEKYTLDTVVDCKKLREIIPNLPLTSKFNRNLKPEDLKDMEDNSQRQRIQRPYGNHQRVEPHQEVQNPGEEGNQHKGESSHYPSYRRTADPNRAYPDSFRLTRSSPNQLSISFTPVRNQQISGKESQFFTIPGSFLGKTRIQGQKQDLFQPNVESVRPNNPEAVRLGERSTQEPEIVVNTSRISSPNNRNITPTHNEHSVVTPESNLNSDAL
ncbi:hypothetical protein O181_006591 [Austropuccinia psidii MF-1]|uniref:Uncharacterized protein n=1 Tax=Austropuccinia psidii MF-1 TaxID=1389203 RepID=A0A9Q3BJD9_9BASI|nr:hypothetical protein [Austropuccinia psidii MF-1]